ncbi:MAG: GAF domain-containing protein [Anaerolineae bacterium]|nr:GAF domain-containing protein [Anaerolineae bacterium]
MDAIVFERVLDISRKMAETRQLDPLLDYAMCEAIKLVGAQRGYLVLLSDDGTFDFRVQRDQDGNLVEDGEDQISTSIMNRVVESGEPILIEDAMSDQSFGKSISVVELKLRSVMCVPLISRGITIGAVFVENRLAKGVFEKDDLPPLILFANQAAVSIVNAMLNDDLEARVAVRTAELERAKENLERSWLEAVEANRLRTVFLGNVAHDIRSPLTMAVSALSLFKDGTIGNLDEEQLSWVDQMSTGIRHALDLIRDLFDLAKIDMGQLTLYPERIDLHTFLGEVYTVGNMLRWNEGVMFHLDIDDDLPEMVIDPIRIRQVILNLLTNACKYTKSGEVALYAHTLPDQETVLIGVADTGIGIPTEQLEAIFERFRQGDQDMVHRQHGTGLGLAICRELVDMHGGQIWAESAVGEGADFKFVLPLAGN